MFPHLIFFFSVERTYFMTKPIIFLDGQTMRPSSELPDGPHALLWIPSTLKCSLQTCTGTEVLPDVQTFCNKVPYLFLQSDLGSCLFDTRPFLTHLSMYYIQVSPSQNGKVVRVCLCIRLQENTQQGVQQLHTLCRLLVRTFQDCAQGHAIRCILTGVGNKVQCTDHTLTFTTGISHRIGVHLPETIWVRPETPTQFTLFGLQRDEVTQWASILRHQTFRKNAYALPVLHYEGENIIPKKTRKK